MATIASLLVNIAADTSDLKRSIAEANGTLDKFGAVAKASLVGIVGGIGLNAVKNFANELLRMGDEITKVSERTGMSTNAVQELGFVASQSGNTIEELTAALGQMQNRLASGDDSAVAAMGKLGLNIRAIAMMEPDEQFYTIAKAIAAIPDPMQRTQVAMDLFGKSGAAILSTMLSDFQKLRDEAPKLSATMVAELAKAGDAIAAIGLRAKIAGAYTLNALVDLAKATTGVKGLFAANDYTEVLRRNAKKIVADYADVAKAFLPVDRAAGALTLSMKELKQVEADLERQGKSLWEAQQRDAAAAAKQFKALVADIKAIEFGGGGAAEGGWANIGRVIDEVGETEAFIKILEKVKEIESGAHQVGGEIATWGRILMDEVFVGFDSVSKKIKTGLLGVLADFPALLQSALTGGGGMAGAMTAVGSSIGSILGKGLFEKLASNSTGFLGKFGAKIGGAIFDMLPGIGGALGALVMPAIGWIGNKLFKTEGKHVNDLRDAFIAAAGGLFALNSQAAAAGMTLDALLQADTVKEYEAAIAHLNKELAATAAIQSTLAGLQQQLADRQIMDWQKAEELIAKYGGTLGNLGQQFTEAKRAASWKEVWDDWQTLIDMGADVGGVLISMQNEIQTLVQDSIAAGSAIPKQFEPLIAELIRTGQLFDANGQAITDLAALKFGAPLVSEVDKIIAKIDELIDALTNRLTPALDLAFRPREAPSGGAGGGGTAVINIDGRRVAELVVPYVPGVVQDYQLA